MGSMRIHRDSRTRRCACAAALLVPLFLSGCIEITTYVSPAASGTVIDAVSQKPLEGATVSVDEHPGLFTQTNSDGQFFLAATTRKTHIFLLAPYESLPPGGTVVVTADGYASKEIAVRGNAPSLLVALDRIARGQPNSNPHQPQ
jgi:CarboxypepD_reg-like domain